MWAVATVALVLPVLPVGTAAHHPSPIGSVNLGPGAPRPTPANRLTTSTSDLSRPAARLYNLSFYETGLPYGFSWNVYLSSIGDGSGGNVNPLTFQVPNGSYPFTVSPTYNYVPSPARGTVGVNGGDVNFSIAFSTAVTFSVTFQETGLAPGTSWGMTVKFGDTGETLARSTSSANFTFQLRNDSYSYTLTEPARYGLNASSGLFTVAGTAITIPVPYHFGRTSVVFFESGLPVGTNWSVMYGNQTNSSVSPSIECYGNRGNVSYSVPQVGAYVPTPRTGVVPVNPSGGVQDFDIQFALPTWPMIVQESGLPTGTTWTITVNGTTTLGNGNQINVSEPNGTFGYRVGGVSGFTADHYAGSVSIAGHPGIAYVVFNETVYQVAFRESGLAAGTRWTIGAGNWSQSGSTPDLALSLPNGSYPVHATPVSGYVENVTGMVEVAGANSTVAVLFSSTGTASTPFLTPATEEWIGIGAVAAAAVGVGLMVVLRRRAPSN